MKSQSESQKGERLIRGAFTWGLASEEPPGRPGNGWRGLSGLDSGSAASRENSQERGMGFVGQLQPELISPAYLWL